MKRVLLTLASLIAFVIGGFGSSQAADWPANVRAVYDINFNGFNVGTFEFQSQSEDESYTLTGNAQLDLAARGVHLDRRDARFRPDRQQHAQARRRSLFDFKANSKIGSTKMDFADGVVADVRHSPPPVPKPGTVPLRQQHLKGRARSPERDHGRCARLQPQPLRPPPADFRRQGALRSRLELQGADEGERAAAERPARHGSCLPGQIPADRRATRWTPRTRSWQRRMPSKWPCVRFPAPTS